MTRQKPRKPPNFWWLRGVCILLLGTLLLLGFGLHFDGGHPVADLLGRPGLFLLHLVGDREADLLACALLRPVGDEVSRHWIPLALVDGRDALVRHDQAERLAGPLCGGDTILGQEFDGGHEHVDGAFRVVLAHGLVVLTDEGFQSLQRVDVAFAQLLALLGPPEPGEVADLRGDQRVADRVIVQADESRGDGVKGADALLGEAIAEEHVVFGEELSLGNRFRQEQVGAEIDLPLLVRLMESAHRSGPPANDGVGDARDGFGAF